MTFFLPALWFCMGTVAAWVVITSNYIAYGGSYADAVGVPETIVAFGIGGLAMAAYTYTPLPNNIGHRGVGRDAGYWGFSRPKNDD